MIKTKAAGGIGPTTLLDMAATTSSGPAEYPILTVDDAASADAGRIPVTRGLVMEAVEAVMLQDDRPAFRPGGALEQAGGVSSASRDVSDGTSITGTK